jgi:hydrogenase nickel incorporation protein HypA/HybF
MGRRSYVEGMHEFSLALSLIEAVEQKAKEVGATSVVYIKLRVGMATTVVPEFMAEAFEVAKMGSLAENATLEIELEPYFVFVLGMQDRV